MDWFVFCILMASFATTGWSYPTPVDLDGKLHKWPITSDNPFVYFEVNGDEALSSMLEEISDQGASTWSNVDQSLLKLRRAEMGDTAQITINFQTSITGGDMAAGYSIFDDVVDGVPRHCSITIAADAGADTYNLIKTTTHEIGHCLGLGHSLIPESIMSYRLDKNSLNLSADDRAVLSRLYPIDGSDARLAPGCSVSGHSPWHSTLWLFFLVISVPFLSLGLKGIMTHLVKN